MQPYKIKTHSVKNYKSYKITTGFVESKFNIKNDNQFVNFDLINDNNKSLFLPKLKKKTTATIYNTTI